MHALPRLPLERHRLDNGLRVVLQPDATLPLVAVNLWYHVGSQERAAGPHRLRPPVRAHALPGQRATSAPTSTSATSSRSAASPTARPGYDRTNYYETLPSHQLELALWLESDRMGFLLPALTQEKLDNQRDVVHERAPPDGRQPALRPRLRASPRAAASRRPHPYHWPVIGYVRGPRGRHARGRRALLPHASTPPTTRC